MSTLELRVDGVRFTEVSGLFGQKHDARVYELRHADDGIATVQFGDGIMGAKPATGAGNITATYRVGAGLVGRVGASTLTTLLAKPTGLDAVTNPLAAEGGADPESLAQARDNAPRTVRTFGRAVSLLDFEDLVTVSGEVAKARATWVWDGLERLIHLTIAGQEGGIFSAEVLRDLGKALDRARDPNIRLRIDNYSEVFVQMKAGIGVHPDYDEETVLEAAHDAVEAALAFDALRLGQPLHLSDLYRVLQDVEGVVFADIDLFHFKPPTGLGFWALIVFLLRRGADLRPVQGHLRIFPARPDPDQPGQVLPAELAAVESPSQDITILPRAVPSAAASGGSS